MDALEAIRAERQRQIEAEGWTPEHDAEHEPGHLLRAGVIYLWHGTDKAAPMDKDGAPLGWPWEPQWWKPKDRRRNLIRAGALMLAEKDAIKARHGLRIAQRGGGDEPDFPFTDHVDQKLDIVLRELAAL